MRVALAKEMARPRMDQLKATEESGYNFGTGEVGGSGGNARLDPWRAYAFDISYEKYFAERGGYRLGRRRSTRTCAATSTPRRIRDHDFSYLLDVTPPGFFAPGVTPAATGPFTRPINGQGGYLWGLELATSLQFGMFSDALDGFGAILSYSYTESDIAIPGSISSVASRASRCRACPRTSGTRRSITRSTASPPASPRATAPSTSAR